MGVAVGGGVVESIYDYDLRGILFIYDFYFS